MRVTPKMSDIPTETRKRNMATDSPLITWTTMSGPLVIQGNRLVTASTLRLLLLLGRRGRPEVLHLLAAARDLLTLDLLDVGGERLTLGIELHDAEPLRRQRLLIAAAHDHRAPREVHLEPFAQHADDLLRIRALRPLNRFRDDLGARVAPGGAELGLRVLEPLRGGPLRVLLGPRLELGVALVKPGVVPGERRGDRADRGLLAEWIELVGIAHRGRDEPHLLEEPEGARLLHERDGLGAPHRAEEPFGAGLEQRRDVRAVIALAELGPVQLDELDVRLELLEIGRELLPHVVAVLVVGRDVRPLLRGHPHVLVHVVRGVGDVPVAVVPREPRGLAVGGEVQDLGVLGVRGDGEAHRARDAPGQEVDLILKNKLAGGLDGLVGLQLVVAMNELERPAENAAGVVDLLRRQRQAFLVGEGVDRGDAAIGVDLADLDRLGLRAGAIGPGQDTEQSDDADAREGATKPWSHGAPPDAASSRDGCSKWPAMCPGSRAWSRGFVIDAPERLSQDRAEVIGAHETYRASVAGHDRGRQLSPARVARRPGGAALGRRAACPAPDALAHARRAQRAGPGRCRSAGRARSGASRRRYHERRRGTPGELLQLAGAGAHGARRGKPGDGDEPRRAPDAGPAGGGPHHAAEAGAGAAHGVLARGDGPPDQDHDTRPVHADRADAERALP